MLWLLLLSTIIQELLYHVGLVTGLSCLGTLDLGQICLRAGGG